MATSQTALTILYDWVSKYYESRTATVPLKDDRFLDCHLGKHGFAKAVITGEDIFSDKQYEETFGIGDMIQDAIVVNTDCTCLEIDTDGVLMLIDGEGTMK